MINAVHALIFSRDAEKTRSFFRDTFQWPSVDAGGGWLIFALPPAELAIHPADAEGQTHHELYLMCDDIDATCEELRRRGVEFTEDVSDERFGRVTRFRVPGYGEMALYEPSHPVAALSRL